MDILDKLRDLHKQATTERSHYYVASCAKEAIAEIESLRQQLIEGVGSILSQVRENKSILDDTKNRMDQLERNRGAR